MDVVELLAELGGVARRRALLQVVSRQDLDVRRVLIAATALAELLNNRAGRGRSAA